MVYGMVNYLILFLVDFGSFFVVCVCSRSSLATHTNTRYKHSITRGLDREFSFSKRRLNESSEEETKQMAGWTCVFLEATS